VTDVVRALTHKHVTLSVSQLSSTHDCRGKAAAALILVTVSNVC